MVGRARSSPCVGWGLSKPVAYGMCMQPRACFNSPRACFHCQGALCVCGFVLPMKAHTVPHPLLSLPTLPTNITHASHITPSLHDAGMPCQSSAVIMRGASPCLAHQLPTSLGEISTGGSCQHRAIRLGSTYTHSLPCLPPPSSQATAVTGSLRGGHSLQQCTCRPANQRMYGTKEYAGAITAVVCVVLGRNRLSRQFILCSTRPSGSTGGRLLVPLTT